MSPADLKTAREALGMSVLPADLKAARTALGLTQAAIADALGIPCNTWARWERGVLLVEKPKILRLALDRLSQERASTPGW